MKMRGFCWGLCKLHSRVWFVCVGRRNETSPPPTVVTRQRGREAVRTGERERRGWREAREKEGMNEGEEREK